MTTFCTKASLRPVVHAEERDDQDAEGYDDEPGTTGAACLRTTTSASETIPTSNVHPLVVSSPVTKRQSFSKKSPSALSIPKSFGSWPTMIVRAMVIATKALDPLVANSAMAAAESRTAIPNVLTGVKESIARIQPGS